MKVDVGPALLAAAFFGLPGMRESAANAGSRLINGFHQFRLSHQIPLSDDLELLLFGAGTLGLYFSRTKKIRQSNTVLTKDTIIFISMILLGITIGSFTKVSE